MHRFIIVDAFAHDRLDQHRSVGGWRVIGIYRPSQGYDEGDNPAITHRSSCFHHGLTVAQPPFFSRGNWLGDTDPQGDVDTNKNNIRFAQQLYLQSNSHSEFF
jgi:hypothetical protein